MPEILHEEKSDIAVLDVREIREYEEEGHISKTAHAYVGYLPAHISEVERLFPKDSPVAVTCSVGHRASLAVSILHQHGFKNVFNLLGGMTAWNALNLPREKGKSEMAPLDEGSIEKDFPCQKQERCA
ncbi:MAG: rhodanese-like domain-containing protein [Nitrosomonas sp.]|nr:rhodanese-like domain-containing protein [Nitrosomonas sp.]